MKLGVAVIGCGDLGAQHARGWAAREDAHVVAVYDPLTERAGRVAGEVGARAFGSWQDAVAHDGVAVVSVCTPIAYHSEVAIYAARHGRHVLTEKAIALTVADAEAMIAAARDHGVLLSVGFQYRALGRNLRYREMFQSGAFGGPVFIRYTDVREVRPKVAMHRQSLNNGPVVDMAGHHFDLVRFFTGEEPVSVYAAGHVFGKGKPRLAEVDDFAVDAATIEVRLSGGHVLTEFVNWGMPEGFRGFGEELFVGSVMSARTVDGAVECTWPGRTERIPNAASDPAGPAARIADIAGAILNGHPLEVTGADGLIALKVSLAALESIASGEAVAVG